MTDRPVLFASYSGVLGGAERVLLDCATRLERPVVGRLPGGPAGRGAARGGDRARADRRSARCELGPRARRRRRRPARGTSGGSSPAGRSSPGARGRCSPRRFRARRRRWLAVHHDLLSRRRPRASSRAATRRADAVAAASHAIAASSSARGHGAAPRRRPRRVHPARRCRRRPAARARARRARGLEAAGAGARDRRADARAAPDARRRAAARRRRPLEAELRARAADLGGRVTLAGRVADVPRRARRAPTCLLHCADAEPYGLALVEALAAGRPVVAPAAAGPLEIVTGGAGRLYPPGDARAAAAALRAVLADPEAPAAARRRAEAAFDVRDSVRRSRRRRRRDRGRPLRATHGRDEFAAVIVLHESRAELASAARSPCRPAPRLDRRRHRPATTAAPQLAAAHGAEVIVRRDNPGFGAANNVGARSASPRTSRSC